MNLDSPNLRPVSISYPQWVPLQYCLTQQQGCAFKENLPAIPLDCALTHIMKCFGTELTFSCSLVALQGCYRLTENGGGWKGPLEVPAQAGTTTATRVSCPSLCQATFKYLQWW